MGASYSSEDTPHMCFNAAKYYQVPWVSDKAVTVNPLTNPSYSTTLAGVAVYETTTAPAVVIKINDPVATNYDYYMMFNARTGANSETKEGANQILIVTNDRGEGKEFSQSWLVAKLGAGSTFVARDFGSTGGDVVVTVRSISTGSGTTPWSADVSIVYTPPPPPPPTEPPQTEPPVLDECSNIVWTNQCLKTEGCRWVTDKEVCASDNCSEIAWSNPCQNTEGCRWAHDREICVSDEPSCSDIPWNKQCLNAMGCRWSNSRKECVRDCSGIPWIKQCLNTEGCRWSNTWKVCRSA